MLWFLSQRRCRNTAGELDFRPEGEETHELDEELAKSAPDKDRISDGLGDTLFALANLARHLDIDPEESLRRTNRKFRKRFAAIEAHAVKTDTTLEAMTLDEMEAAWQAAKNK